MTSARPVVVIGMGNLMSHDDGIGPSAIRNLGEQAPIAADLIELSGESAGLVDAWRNRQCAIVIDAISSGAPPGEIHRFQLGHDDLPNPPPATSTHRGGLAEAVELSRVLDRLPDELVVYGVEGSDFSPGPGLSPAVAAALPLLVNRVRSELYTDREVS